MSARRVDPNGLPRGGVLAALLEQQGVAGRAPVRIEHDAHTVWGRAGEPLAVSLLSAGIDALARSVKFHRPRGPACMRGACDGCLVRLDGVPNVMACRVTARDGARIHSQNAFPSARLDVLRVTDWFFPKAFDHHHLMVDYGPAINRAMQVFARRMAGLGTLPDLEGPVPDPEHWDGDVLVVGAGPAGLSCAYHLARAGLRVLLVEEEPAPGGTLLDELSDLASPGESLVTGAAFARALTEACVRAGVQLRTSASAVATFDEGTVVALGDRALWVRARARVFANGSHEVIDAVANNDLPGVYTGRAVARALSHGVRVGERVALVGDAWPGAGLAKALREAGAAVIEVQRDSVEGIDGGARAKAVLVRGAKKVKCDAVAIATPGAPAYELAGQSGVGAAWVPERGSFAPLCDEDGATERGDVFVTGSLRGVEPKAFAGVSVRDPMSAGGAVEDGARVAKRVSAQLGSNVRELRAERGRAR